MGFNEEYLKLRKKRLKDEEDGKTREIITPYRRPLASDAPTRNVTTVLKEDGASGDIAPVTFGDYAKENKSNNTVTEEKTEEKERTWFKRSGLWDDGYQFGDVTKAILGTHTDAGENMWAGLLGIGEKAVDTLAMMGNAIAQGQIAETRNNEIMYEGLKQITTGEEARDPSKIIDDYAAYGEKVEKGVTDFVKKDLYDEEAVAKVLISDTYKKITGRDAEEDSVFGEKADDLAQSGGQLLGTAALQAVGVPAWLTIGATAFGSEAESALNQDATYEEAFVSGAISAGAEILTEKISGGVDFGMGTFDEGLSSALAGNISSKTWQTLAKLGVDMTGEGAEEVFSNAISAIGQKLTYDKDKDVSFKELFLSEEAFEAFIGGAVLGGVGSGGEMANNVIHGNDAVTGLKADTEQKVVDKLYKEALADAETDGKKLTPKDKKKLYDGVLNDLEKGYISTNTIEEVLGGEDYKHYQNEIKRQQDLDNELNELRNMKSGEMTDIQQERMSELKAMKPNTEMVNALKFGIDEQIRNSIKDTRLVESYNEKARRGQAFEADLSQYDAKQAEVVKKAIDSGILNNTNRTHEFVDLVAKISADKGVPFDFTNNEKIKETGFAVENATVNGYLDRQNNVIGVNIQSAKALNTVVGHEITHVLEGTELYGELSKVITEYAKSKGDYDGRIESLKKLYKPEDVDAELTADLVGEYLFEDTDFIKNLSVEHRNVFQKIYDEIKYLAKVATAGSKEARELEKVKKVFEQAYRESGNAKNTANDSGVKYSLNIKHTDGSVEVLADARNLTNEQAIGYLKQAARGELRGETYIPVRKDTPQVIIDTLEQVNENISNSSLVMQVRKAKQSMSTENPGGQSVAYGNNVRSHGLSPEEVIDIINKLDDPSAAIYQTNRTDKNGKALPNNVAFFVEYNKNGAEGVAVIEFDSSIDSDSIGTDFGDTNYHTVITVFEPDTQRNGMEFDYVEELLSNPNNYELEIKRRQSTESATREKHPNTSGKLPSIEAIVPQKEGNVNTKFSISSDSDGKNLTKEQSEYFKDSKMRDENGNLKVMYHGSQNAGFHIFDPSMSDDGVSLFFVDRNDVAASYSGTSETYEAQTVNTAEDVNKFIESIGIEGYEVVENNGKFTLLYEGERVADSNTAKGIYEEFCWYEGVGEGDANYKVYLNLTNPLEIDAKGKNWNNISREYSQEIADRYNSLTAEEKAALTNLAEWGEYSIFRDEMLEARATAEQGGYGVFDEAYTKNLAKAYEKLGGANANLYDAFSIASDNFSAESIKQFAVKQMNTRDYAKKAQAEGYDGVIFNNIVDVGGYSNGSEGASTVAIAFNSEQVKSVANEKPTADKDIRFSLSSPVEETKDLVAMHNVRADKLMEAFRLGGLPAPSIAITKSDILHDNYGDITLLMRKNAIDPQADRRNKVYGSDAWTPTSSNARMEYEVDVKKVRSFEEKLAELSRKVAGGAFVRDSIVRGMGIDDISDQDAKRLSERLANYDEVRAAYLADNGKTVEPEYKTKEYNKFGNAALQKYIDRVGEQRLASIVADSYTGDMASIQAEEETVKQIIRDAYIEKHAYSLNKRPDLKDVRVNLYMDKNVNAFTVEDFINDAWEFYQDGGAVTEEIDRLATSDKLRSAVNDADVRAWLEPQIDAFLGEPGIYNGKDPYFSDGSRRSFAETHYTYTAENIVKAMQNVSARGANTFGAHANSLIATATPSYQSIAEMHADKGRLKLEEAATYEKILSDLDGILNSVEHDIMRTTKHHADNTFDEEQIIGSIITEAATGARTVAAVQRAFAKEDYKISAEQAKRILSLYDKAANVPTGYFEAKPNRVVGFDEVGVFVIPYNADPKLKQELLNRGYAIAEYNPDVEGDRQKVVNSFEEYKFSLSAEGEAPVRKRGSIYGEDVRLEAPTRADVAPMVDNTVDEAVDESVPDGYAPIENAYTVEQKLESVRNEMVEVFNEYNDLLAEGKEAEANALLGRFEELNENSITLSEKVDSLKAQERADTEGYINSLGDADAPPEMDAPYYEDGGIIDPFDERDYTKVGNQKVKSYMTENPEVKPYFQAEAERLLQEYQSGEKAHSIYNGWQKYEMTYEAAQDIPEIYRVKRDMSPSIEYLRDNAKMSYDDIEKGLKAIIEGNKDINTAAAKKVEVMIHDRLMNGYTDASGYPIPANQEYRDLIKSQGVLEGREEAFKQLIKDTNKSERAQIEDIAPPPTITTSRNDQIKGQQRWADAIKPKGEKAETAEPRMKRVDNPSNAPSGMEERRWVGTSTSSEAVDGMVTPDDIPDEVRYYQVKSNKKTLETANTRLARDGYAKSREYFESKMYEKKLTVEDIALGERLIQEAAKAGDAKAVQDLIIDVSIIGTELGQRVQALSIIQRLTPEGQLKALHRMVERGKTRGDKAYSNVDITDDITDGILKTYKEDGTFDKADLDRAVEDAKQKLADQMEVTTGEKLNAWRYLAMLGNPKTHIRNLVSNVAMMGTRAVKNTIARTIEDIAPIQTRTKTWARATEDVKKFAQQTTLEMDSAIKGDTKYSEESSIKAKRQMFKTKPLNAVNKFNQNALEWEDAVFSKPVFRQTLQEYLTANGIKTEADILNNPEIVTKAREYALEEARRATFRQDSYLANKISEVEKKNALFGVAVGSIMPFKRTPINIAKTGLAYSPLGFARNIYDAVQVKKGNMDASEAVDHLAQTLTGTSLTLIGYALASAGMLNGAGEDDKEGKYDYQLGEQSYSFNFGGDTYSLSWLSPVAMPLFVGANAYEKLVEGEEWDANVVIDTLAQTLDPLSEMSFLSSLDDVLSSYDSGIEKFMGAGESMVQNYATQFVPTLSSQVAATFDDTKRSTAASRDSGFKFGEETLNKIKYKIPGLRNTLAPTTDIWGNEAKQTENVVARGFESFFSPANKRAGIATAVDEELKSLYGETDDSGVLPSIPQSYINYDGERYDMSTEEFTEYKKLYGQTAYELMEKLFNTETYKNASSEERADMVNRVYDYARDNAKKEYFAGIDLDFTNATKDGVEVYKENSIVGAIEADLPVDEYEFSTEYPEKYKFFKVNDLYQSYKEADEDGKRAYNWAFSNRREYEMSKSVYGDFLTYYGYKSTANDFDAKDEYGETVSGLKKERVVDYINGLDDLDYGQKIILYRSMYNSKQDREDYNMDIIDYLNSRDDINYAQMKAILEELGMTVDSKGNIYWD